MVARRSVDTTDSWAIVGDWPRVSRRSRTFNPTCSCRRTARRWTTPPGAIDALLAALESCYENYVSISALRHYFPRLFTDYEGRPGQMPIRPGIKPPACLRHFGTTWMLVSETGGAFVMDVGSPDIVDRLKKMLADGEIQRVEGLWVTHYHFDHTDGIVAFQQAFDCPCYTDLQLADVLTRPTAWRLPCLAPETIRVDQPMRDGQSWQWHEFTLTSLLTTRVKRSITADCSRKPNDVRMFFVGDSHTMAGLDDYCAHNRNWLGRGVGFEYCLTLVERLKPTHMFNCHVDDAFTFTPDEIQFMRKRLDEREQMFGQLVALGSRQFRAGSVLGAHRSLSAIRCAQATPCQVNSGHHQSLGQSSTFCLSRRVARSARWHRDSLAGNRRASPRRAGLLAIVLPAGQCPERPLRGPRSTFAVPRAACRASPKRLWT